MHSQFSHVYLRLNRTVIELNLILYCLLVLLFMSILIVSFNYI